MGDCQSRATVQNTEIDDVDCPPPVAALKMTYKGTLLKLSSLDGLKKADREFFTNITDIKIDLSKSAVNSQNIDEALATLKNCPQLMAFRLKMPKLELQSAIKFRL